MICFNQCCVPHAPRIHVWLPPKSPRGAQGERVVSPKRYLSSLPYIQTDKEGYLTISLSMRISISINISIKHLSNWPSSPPSPLLLNSQNNLTLLLVLLSHLQNNKVSKMQFSTTFSILSVLFASALAIPALGARQGGTSLCTQAQINAYYAYAPILSLISSEFSLLS